MDIQHVIIIVIILVILYILLLNYKFWPFNQERFISTIVSKLPASQWVYNGTVYSFAIMGTNMNITIRKPNGSTSTSSGTWSSVDNTTLKVFTNGGHIKLKLINRTTLQYTDSTGTITLTSV